MNKYADKKLRQNWSLQIQVHTYYNYECMDR